MNRLLTPALSLAVLAVTAGCMSPPKDLDLALTRPTVDIEMPAGSAFFQGPARPERHSTVRMVIPRLGR